MIAVRFLKEHGTYSPGDTRSYDDVSAQRLADEGIAENAASSEDSDPEVEPNP